MSVTVRRARQEDARSVAEYAVKLVIQHANYDPRRFARLATVEQAEWYYGSQTDVSDAAVLVAELDGKIVGFAYIQFEARNFAALLENTAWLHDIYIDEAARTAGTGKLLIEKSKEVAKELGADKLILSVAVKNDLAKGFFERSGFRETMVEMMLDLTTDCDSRKV